MDRLIKLNGKRQSIPHDCCLAGAFPAWENHLATRTQSFYTAPREAEPFIAKFSLWFERRIVKSRVITFPRRVHDSISRQTFSQRTFTLNESCKAGKNDLRSLHSIKSLKSVWSDAKVEGSQAFRARCQ